MQSDFESIKIFFLQFQLGDEINKVQWGKSENSHEKH
jgi:hypothetical protein